MATVTGDAVFDAIIGFAAGGSGLSLVNNGTTDTAQTVVNANASITIGNSFRFITERFDISTGRGTGNADNLALQQDNGSQTIITLDTGTTQQDDVILGDLSLSGQLVRAGTGTAPYIFGSSGTPGGDITTGDAADGNNYQWSMVNPEPLTITGTQSNITLHLANLDPFNSMLQVNSVGNSTLQSPAVNAVFGRTPSDTADTQAVDNGTPVGGNQSTIDLRPDWGYADRFVHQLSPVGNGNVGGANYLSCYGLRTHYNVAPMLANTTTDYQQIPPAVSTRRQMLQTNANLQVWLVRPLNGTDPLESTDLIPIGYHQNHFPGANANRLDNEIRVIIPHRLGFTDSVGAAILDEVKVFYEPRPYIPNADPDLIDTGDFNGDPNDQVNPGVNILEIRNAPATFNPTTIPTLLAGNELTITNSTTNGVWIMDAVNVFEGRTSAALRTPLSEGNEVAGMNGDRTFILRSFRYDFPYQNNLGFGSVMTDAVTAGQDIISTTQDLQPYLNGRTAASTLGSGITDWADIFPAIRIDFFDGTPEGPFPLTGSGNTISFPGDLTLTSAAVADDYTGDDVTVRVADNTTLVLTGDITTFILAGTADLSETNIPAGITLDGGTWSNFTGILTNVTAANTPILDIGNSTDDLDITAWTVTGDYTFASSVNRVVELAHAQAGQITNLDGETIPPVTQAEDVVVGNITFRFPAEEARTRRLVVPSDFVGRIATAILNTSTGNYTNVTVFDYTVDPHPTAPEVDDILTRGNSDLSYIVVTTGVGHVFNRQTIGFDNDPGTTIPFDVLPLADVNYSSVISSLDVPVDYAIRDILVEDGGTGIATVNIVGAQQAEANTTTPGWATGLTARVFAECRNDADYIREILQAGGNSDWITLTPSGTVTLTGTIRLDGTTGTGIQFIQGIDWNNNNANTDVQIILDGNDCPTVIVYPNVDGITTTQVQQTLRPDLTALNTNIIQASVKPAAVQAAQGGNLPL